MAHRHTYMSQMFEAETDQQWNQLHSEEQYHHFGRTQSTDNGPSFHHGDNVSAEQVHHASQWNMAPSSNGYPSSTPTVNPPYHQPDTSDPSRDSLRQPATPHVGTIPGNHVHHASSSNYTVESNFSDLSMGNRRGPFKRKSPGIHAISARGSTSRYYCTGNSSDVSSFPEIRQDKSFSDGQHNHWDPFLAAPSYGASQHPIGGESSGRNVRSRPSIDLESDPFMTHQPPNYSDHPCSSRLSTSHSIPNSSAPLPEWNPSHVLGAPHGRVRSDDLAHESSHFFAGSNVTHASGDLAGYHRDHISGRNYVASPSTHSIPPHTRGARSSFAHGSTSNNRVSMGNVRMGHMIPHNEGLQLVGESNSSRHLRPFGHVGWRNGDRNGPVGWQNERYRLFSEDASTHDHLTPEGLMMPDRSYGSRHMLDHHRDMRLDVDNMSYEELLALGERIGSVSTGVCQDQLQKCLTETVWCSSDQSQEEERCVICLDEYKHMDDVGTLKACGHDYHVSCIKKWLSLKNLCPICKGPAVPENLNNK